MKERAFIRFRPIGTKCALFIALACFNAPLPLQADSEALFRRGNEAYSLEDFSGAIQLYEQCLEEATSSALHFNLANAFYKTGDIGRAVLHFEKSLAFDPANQEAKANLAYIRREADLDAPENGPATRLGLRATVGFWSWTASAGFWIALGVLVLPRLFRGGNLATRLVGILAAGAFAASCIALYGYHIKAAEAVVLESDTALRVAPSEQSNEYGYLPAGEVARIAKQHQDYVFVNTGNGKSGWVRADHVDRVRAWTFAFKGLLSDHNQP
jgi:tetratricopeptide (TPR) repeat protein